MKTKIFILIVAMFLFNGLANSRELNDLAILSSMGIELDEDGNYLITVQILNTKKPDSSSGNSSSGGSGTSNVTVFKSNSSTIHGALRDIVLQSSKKIYIAHMELLLVSEEVAKTDMFDILDFFIRDNENSNNFILAVTKDTTPKEVLEILTPLETNPTQSIKNTIKATYKNKGTTIDNILTENIQIMLKPGMNMVAASVGIDGEVKKEEGSDNINSSASSAKVIAKELAYFDKKSLMGYLTEEEGLYYNLGLDDLKSGMLNMGTKEDGYVVEILNAKSSSTPRVENDKYIIDFNFDLSCAITEISREKKIETFDEEVIIQKEIEERIKNGFESFANKCKNEYESDLIGFGNIYYKRLNKEYEKLMAKYGDDYLKHIDINTNVKIKLVNEGSVMSIW